MEENFFKKDVFTAEYKFARDLVAAVIEMRAVYVPNFRIQLDKSFFTVAQRIKIRELFSKEWPQLDELVKRYANRQSEYSDRQFLLCAKNILEEYNSELKSEEEFLLVCCRIAYVAACVLRNNKESNVLSMAADCVYNILVDTFYSTTITEETPLFQDIHDRKYRFAYYLVKTLVEMRGVSVPDLELPDAEKFLFTAEHKLKIKELFSNEYLVIDKLVKSFIYEEEKFSYNDENLSRCMDKIVTDYGSENDTEDEFVFVCARVAYAAAWCMRKNNALNVTKLAIAHIYQMVKHKIHLKKYERDDDYRFACDLVKTVAGMRSNPISVTEMSNSATSFFLIAHRNKIEELLTREKPYLDEVVKTFKNKDGSMNSNDVQFLQCVEQIKGDYKFGYKSKEEMVSVCARIAYAAACFFGLNNKSNAPSLAVDSMLEIVKDIHDLPNSKEEEISLIRPQDDHYRFAYELVKTVLELKNIPISDSYLPDPHNFLFTAKHRKSIENMFLKDLTKLNKMVKMVTIKQGILDYSDSNFLQCMHQIINEYRNDKNTEEEFICICARIAYLSACFLTENFKSNATFLAVNRIYELVKSTKCFSNSLKEQEHILKIQDDNYRFVYDLTKTVFEIVGILVSPIDLPESDNVFIIIDRNKIQEFLSKESSQLDEIVAKLTNKGGRFDYSDRIFLYCMNLIVHAYQSDVNCEDGYLNIFARISYTAAKFLIENHRSNATFLAVNRMYEMSKDKFHLSRTEKEALIEEENCHFAYDLVKAALQMCRNSMKAEIPSYSDSYFLIEQRDAIQDILSKEWPYLHQLVRRFTRRCTGFAFSDGHFLHCIQQIKNDYEMKLTSEDALVLVSSRISYVATCFLRKNKNSNASDLAIDNIYQMRKDFYRSIIAKEEDLFDVDLHDEKYRFAYDLVKAVMELQNVSMPDTELSDTDNFLFTSQHRKKIKKLFRKKISKIDELIRKLTNRGGSFNYSDGSFLLCMDQVFKDNKHEQVTKEGFVRLCAKIAYSAAYFVRKNDESKAATLAISRIYQMTRNIIHFNEDLKVKRLLEDAKDDKYRFAYDLVKSAIEMKGMRVPNVELPNPAKFLFTAQHKRKMETLFSQEEPQLTDHMKRFIFKHGYQDYSDESFLECMDHIIKEYKPKSYTEEGFVLLCARIAYVAACYFKKRCRSNATLLAVDRIHEMVEDIFSRGTLSQSCW